jgi:uncharacterized protein YndB with AHSA1/START domain
MTTTTAADPILLSVTVPLPPDRAFELFTARVAEWWPLAGDHSITGERAAGCTIEPFAGGRVFEYSHDGEEHDWGKVLAFDPPHRVVMTWHPGGGPATEVEVRFTPADDGTYVELEHRGWEAFGDAVEEVRRGYVEGWPFVFGERFGRAAGG